MALTIDTAAKAVTTSLLTVYIFVDGEVREKMEEFLYSE